RRLTSLATFPCPQRTASPHPPALPDALPILPPTKPPPPTAPRKPTKPSQRPPRTPPPGPIRSVSVHRPTSRAIFILRPGPKATPDRKSTRLNSSHVKISYAVFCLKNRNIYE